MSAPTNKKVILPSCNYVRRSEKAKKSLNVLDEDFDDSETDEKTLKVHVLSSFVIASADLLGGLGGSKVFL